MQKLRPFLTAAILAGASLAATAADVNQATLAELEQLRGLGPALAERIVADRANGAFRDWPDLIRRVPGLGHVSAARLSAAGLTVAGAGYTAAAPAAASR